MPRSTQPKGWLATLAVLVIMVGILVAGFFASESVAAIPTGPVTVLDGVTLTPADGWEFVGRSDDGATVLLTKGNGSLAVTVTPGADVRAALAATRDEWVASGSVTASELTDAEEIRPGEAGVRFSYSGTFDTSEGTVDGEVTGFAGTNVVVQFDGWASVGTYATTAADVESMIKGATIL